MSDVELSLGLNVSQVTGPAVMAVAHLEKIKSSAKKASKALDFSDQAKRSADELTRIRLDPKGFLAARESMKKLREEQQKLIKSQEGGMKSMFKWVTPYGLGRLGSNILGNLGSSAIEGVGHALVDGARAAVDIIKEGIAKAFEVGGKEEHLQGSFKYLFGGAGQAKAVLDEAERFSKSLPFGGQKTAGYLGELGKAGIKGQAAASSLALGADAGAMSPDGQGTDEALYALEKLKRHGEFSPRLAEGLNINLTDFYAAIGHKLNVSAADAQKQLGENGKVGFNTILNTLMEIHSRAIGAPTGSVALEQSKELMQRWEKIKELPEEYLRSIASSPGWTRLSDTLGSVLDQLDPQKHPEIVSNLVDAFGSLAKQAERALTPENVKKFSDAMANLPATLQSIAGTLNTVLRFSEAIAAVWTASKMLAALDLIVKILPVAGTVAGTATSAITTGVAATAAVTAGVYAAPLASNFNNPQEQAQQDTIKARGDADVASGQTVAHKHWWGTTYDYNQGGGGRPGSPSSPSMAPQINITVPQINVAVNPAKDDVNHTGQQVGVEVHRAATQAFERAAQEAGAS